MIRTTYTDFLKHYAAARENVDDAHDAALVLNCVLWGVEIDESYHATTIEDAVMEFFEYRGEYDKPCALTVTGVKRAEIQPHHLDAECFLERVLEHLDQDCELGDPDDGTAPTAGMRAAAEAFIAAMKREYTPWSCEEAVEVTFTAQEVERLIADDAAIAAIP